MNREGLTKEAVRWGYQWLLGRDPEPGVDHGPLTMDELRLAALQSDEFLEKHPRVPALHGTEARMPIERVVDSGDLEMLFTHIGSVWQELGDSEPHWSVLTADEYRRENLAASLEEFYATGDAMVRVMEQTLQRNGIDSSSWTSCMEYGCGVGRITRWLANRFDEVHGYDISRPHLDVAESYMQDQGVANVSLHQVQSIRDLDEFPTVDCVFTFIVLQHNPPPVIERLLERLLQAVAPGGVAFFQVPTYVNGYGFSLDSYLRDEASKKRMEMHAVPQSTVFDLIHDTGCRLVEHFEDTCLGARPREMSSRFLVRRPANQKNRPSLRW